MSIDDTFVADIFVVRVIINTGHWFKANSIICGHEIGLKADRMTM